MNISQLPFTGLSGGLSSPGRAGASGRPEEFQAVFSGDRDARAAGPDQARQTMESASQDPEAETEGPQAIQADAGEEARGDQQDDLQPGAADATEDQAEPEVPAEEGANRQRPRSADGMPLQLFAMTAGAASVAAKAPSGNQASPMGPQDVVAHNRMATGQTFPPPSTMSDAPHAEAGRSKNGDVPLRPDAPAKGAGDAGRVAPPPATGAEPGKTAGREIPVIPASGENRATFGQPPVDGPGRQGTASPATAASAGLSPAPAPGQDPAHAHPASRAAGQPNVQGEIAGPRPASVPAQPPLASETGATGPLTAESVRQSPGAAAGAAPAVASGHPAQAGPKAPMAGAQASVQAAAAGQSPNAGPERRAGLPGEAPPLVSGQAKAESGPAGAGSAPSSALSTGRSYETPAERAGPRANEGPANPRGTPASPAVMPGAGRPVAPVAAPPAAAITAEPFTDRDAPDPAADGGDLPLQPSDTRQSAVPPRADLARHVAAQVAQALPRQAGGPVEIRLDPEELGRLRLQITSDDISVTLHVTTERADTSDLMRRHIAALEENYRALGFEKIQISINGQQAGSARHGFAQQHGTGGGDTGAPLQPSEDTATVEPPRARPARIAGTDRIDIRL